MSPKPHRFVRYVLAWMLTALIGLTLLGSLELEVFFVVSLIGMLVITELMTPMHLTPAWHRRLRWVILIGLLGFAYIVIQRVLELLPVEFTLGF